MRKVLAFLFTFTVLFYTQAQDGKNGQKTAEESKASVEDQRLDTIRYGTDAEITALIKNIKSEQTQVLGETAPDKAVKASSAVDKAFIVLAEGSKNKNILTGVFDFMGERKISGLEDRALRALEERDDEAAETVSAAIAYLGRLEYAQAEKPLEEILDSEETRFLTASIRALGKMAKNSGGDEIAEFLMNYYDKKDPGAENRREIITALGAAGSKTGVSFLSAIASNNDESFTLRMAALEALSAIGDEDGLPAVIGAASSDDPNVRSAAIGALGPFSGDAVDSAILEAFRDSYFRTRLAAAKAARERKLESAVPYLVFRSEHDEAAVVREESIRAMGAIPGAEKALGKLFTERSSGEKLRVLAAEMLLVNNASSWTGKVIVELEYAKSKKQTGLYNGFLRALGGAKSGSLEDLARRFFASGDVTEKSYALDICLNNNFRGLAAEIRTLSDPKNGSLSYKARRLLESWNIE